MSYTQEFKDWLLSQVNGEIEVSLMCGGNEPNDDGYNRQIVTFQDGVNTEECRFGPYNRNFRQPITGYCLYLGDMCICKESLPPTTPTQDEVSVFQPGSIKLSIN